MGVARLRGCWEESLVSTARVCTSFSIKSTCFFIDDGVEFTSCINLRNAIGVSLDLISCISLAGKRREHQQWSTRHSELLLVSVAIDDGLPQHVCMKCVGQAETLEKTAFLSYTAPIAVTCSGLGLIPWFPVHSSAYFSAFSKSNSSSHI